MSSSRRDSGIQHYIVESLKLLRAECPNAYFLLCGQLAPRSVRLTIDGQPVLLGFDPAGARLLQKSSRPTVELTTTRPAILDVLDARVTLAEAVLADAVLLKGRTEDLAVFHDGLLTYVRGAVRCPSFPALLDSFRYDSQ